MNQSGEKTEKATPKRRKEAREKGQVKKSIEVNTAFTLIIMFGALKMFGPWMVENLITLIGKFISGESTYSKDISFENVMNSFMQAGLLFAAVAAPMLAVALIAGVVINVAQVRFLFSTKALKPDFGRVNPLKGLKRLFSMRTFIDLLKSLLKIVIIGVIAYTQIVAYINDYSKSMSSTLAVSAAYMFDTIINTGFTISIALLIFSGFDYAYQWWRYEKDLKMTKYEVKMEHKQLEGDPQIKGKIRQKQMQMGMMRMMQRVPDADVVITNPTHYAIALKYNAQESSAPKVIAKGVDYLAQRIRQLAIDNDIEIVEDRPLARTLYDACQIGSEIPYELYQAVAEILAQVYRAKNKL